MCITALCLHIMNKIINYFYDDEIAVCNEFQMPITNARKSQLQVTNPQRVRKRHTITMRTVA